MTDTDCDHLATFELELAFAHRIRNEQLVRDLAWKQLLPETIN